MTGPAGDTYPKRKLTPEGKDPEVKHPRDLGENQIQLAKVNEMIPDDILLYS